jgi:hypothetical protein
MSWISPGDTASHQRRGGRDKSQSKVGGCLNRHKWLHLLRAAWALRQAISDGVSQGGCARSGGGHTRQMRGETSDEEGDVLLLAAPASDASADRGSCAGFQPLSFRMGDGSPAPSSLHDGAETDRFGCANARRCWALAGIFLRFSTSAQARRTKAKPAIDLTTSVPLQCELGTYYIRPAHTRARCP